jgi:hypothetical protein
MGRASKKKPAAESDSEPQWSTVAKKMVSGLCVHPECLVLRAAEEALQAGAEAPARSNEANVLVQCTFAQCTAGGQMHAECFARLEKEALRLLDSKMENLSKLERIKTIWTSKYNLHAKHTCRCDCCIERNGKGTPETTSRAHHFASRARGARAGAC